MCIKWQLRELLPYPWFHLFFFVSFHFWKTTFEIQFFCCCCYSVAWTTDSPTELFHIFFLFLLFFNKKNKILFRLTARRWDINEHIDTLGRAWWDLWPFLLFLSFSTTLRSTPNKYKYGTCTTFIGTEPMRTGCSLVRECLIFLSFFKKNKETWRKLHYSGYHFLWLLLPTSIMAPLNCVRPSPPCPCWISN